MKSTHESIPGKLTFVDQLRHATTGSHSRLESLPISGMLMSSKLTDTDYTKYLLLMREVIAATEDEVFPMISEFIPDGAVRLKSHLINSDLEKLNCPIADTNFNFNPRSTAFAFGIFYVVEGSTLGGRYILKNVTATLERDEESGAAYFSGYGNATGSMWKKFLNALSDYAATTHQHDEIIEGAKFAFDSIHNHFKKACK